MSSFAGSPSLSSSDSRSAGPSSEASPAGRFSGPMASETLDLKLMQGFRFTASSSGPHLLATGGVHGDEFEPIAALRRLVRLLESGDLPLRCGRLTVLPLVNESAFWRGHRTGEDLLDLARTCPGRADGTLTEQVALIVSEQIRGADAYVDLHTGGTELTVSPMTGYVLHAAPAVLARQREMARAFNLPLIWGTSPELSGRTLSIARDAGVPAIYAEHGGGARCSEDGIEDYLAGCLNLLGLLGMIDRPPAVSRVEQVVEDPRPDSGHMQRCNPAPMAGFFEPAVTLGAMVAAGDLLGTIHGADHRSAQQVHVGGAGRVLVLRTFPRVQQGETLGVIMEMVATG
ncbi:succinylglutamate desuccinylase/aspartoacylase family protein [Lignipirellula cremea]|uniref:Succinylglutamate desuccinylase / Aspartoacylase family protein n=1 Tax=Lignipirellula cremea TaxID=2528010 RepID=A0A518DMX6_9BACT|nr:M14 family metallopeptidase [Lignipirellula cremea]QDU93173.1 Succinylglutamate desuccinylase / Aspartoacylase family protein [Lignipirellula cremea]